MDTKLTTFIQRSIALGALVETLESSRDCVLQVQKLTLEDIYAAQDVCFFHSTEKGE